MTELKNDLFVRHRALGLGRIVSTSASYVIVRFPGPREVRFQAANAPALLEVVEPSLVPASAKAAITAKAAIASTKGKTAAKCTVCGDPLKQSRYAQDGLWKACPKCSAADGEQHVLRPYPGAFGVTTKRETGENPEGVQSYCIHCRQGEDPNREGTRRCADLPTQVRQP